MTNFQYFKNYIFTHLFYLNILMARQLQVSFNSRELILEPLSIFSVIFQLATVAPEINNVFIKKETYDPTRTEIIELYRNNMISNFQDKPNN